MMRNSLGPFCEVSFRPSCSFKAWSIESRAVGIGLKIRADRKADTVGEVRCPFQHEIKGSGEPRFIEHRAIQSTHACQQPGDERHGHVPRPRPQPSRLGGRQSEQTAAQRRVATRHGTICNRVGRLAGVGSDHGSA